MNPPSCGTPSNSNEMDPRATHRRHGLVARTVVQLKVVGEEPDRGLSRCDRLVLGDVRRLQRITRLAKPPTQLGGADGGKGIAQDPVDLGLVGSGAQVRHRRPRRHPVVRRPRRRDPAEVKRIRLDVRVQPDQIGAHRGTVGEHDGVHGVRVGAAAVAGEPGEFGAAGAFPPADRERHTGATGQG